jgi:hypothetical protein
MQKSSGNQKPQKIQRHDNHDTRAAPFAERSKNKCQFPSSALWVCREIHSYITVPAADVCFVSITDTCL